MNQPDNIAGKAASNRKVLIVDDNADIRMLMRVTLGKKYELLEADSGTSALQMIERHQPELVLLDIGMSGELDGLQVLDVVKGNARLRDIVVGMVTARNQSADDKAARARGADAYFVKPFSPRQIIAWVDDCLSAAAPA